MIFRCQMNEDDKLPVEASDAFARDGVIVIEDFVSVAQCEALKQRANELARIHSPLANGKATIFSTHDQRHSKDRYFEESASRIGVFFEDGAIDGDGNLQVPLERAVNKLGHAMHDLDPVFDAFSHGARLQAVSKAVGLTDPLVLQSMYIFKQPSIGGEVVCHQDSTFLYTEPESVVGFWFAIEDAHRGNGCLGGIGGEHERGLRQIYRKNQDGNLVLETVRPELSWDIKQIEWLEVKQGTLIVFHGAFPHLSEANRSSQSRHAYTLHAISAAANYPSSNWLQRRSELDPPFRGFV